MKMILKTTMNFPKRNTLNRLKKMKQIKETLLIKVRRLEKLFVIFVFRGSKTI